MIAWVMSVSKEYVDSVWLTWTTLEYIILTSYYSLPIKYETGDPFSFLAVFGHKYLKKYEYYLQNFLSCCLWIAKKCN
jgi:hypothetical protein